jgi:hypothetical protein
MKMLGNPDLQKEAHSERVGLELYRPREKTVPVRISEASIHRNDSRKVTVLISQFYSTTCWARQR